MKVKDIINARHDLAGVEVKTIVKPMGTISAYYNSEIHNHLENEVGEMKVKNWSVAPAKRNRCVVCIIVEQNEKFEADRKKHTEEFFRNNAE